MTVGASQRGDVHERSALVRTFLLPPDGAAGLVADAIRIVGFITAVVAGFVWGPVAAAVFAFALLGLVATRFLGVRPGFDIAVGLVLTVAAWSNVLELYTSVLWWDIPVHFAANGLLAALVYIAADRAGMRFDERPWPLIGTIVAIGLALAALWEMAEWAGHTFIDRGIFVGYDDSILDMAVGGAGSIIAGAAMPALRERSRWQGSSARAVHHGART